MPKHIFEQSPVTLNGFDVACDIESAELMIGRRPAVDVTGLCDTYEQFLSPNIRRWGCRLNYFVNFDSSSTSSSSGGIYVALKSVFDSTASSGVSFVIRASTGTRSASNPEWSGLVGIDGDFAVHAGAIAEAAKGSVTLKGMGTLSFYTSST
jgi:hypothetical protein